MTSNFTKNCGLSQETLSLWKSIGEYPREIAERLRFYLSYLPEVVPYGVTVHHLPSPSHCPSTDSRTEIQFWLGTCKIFISGLIAMEQNGVNVEVPTANEASRWDKEDFEMNDDGSWRFFTGGDQVRMYNCHPNNEFELLGLYHPIDDAWDLAAQLQRQYDSLKR